MHGEMSLPFEDRLEARVEAIRETLAAEDRLTASAEELHELLRETERELYQAEERVRRLRTMTSALHDEIRRGIVDPEGLPYGMRLAELQARMLGLQRASAYLTERQNKLHGHLNFTVKRVPGATARLSGEQWGLFFRNVRAAVRTFVAAFLNAISS